MILPERIGGNRSSGSSFRFPVSSFRFHE